MHSNLDFEKNFKKLPPSEDFLLTFLLNEFSASSCTRIGHMLLVSFLVAFVYVSITILIKLYYISNNCSLSMTIASFVTQLADTRSELSTVWSFGITALGVCKVSTDLNTQATRYLKKLDMFFCSILAKQHTAKPLFLWISICKLLQSELTALGIIIGLFISITTIIGDTIFIRDAFLSKYFTTLSLLVIFSMFMLTLMPFFRLFTTLQIHLEHFLATIPHLKQTVYVTPNDNRTIKLCITDFPPTTSDKQSP